MLRKLQESGVRKMLGIKDINRDINWAWERVAERPER
jgi:hypothetical protein